MWLDAERTSPYQFYQFWVNVDDRDVERLLKLYTFLPLEDVRLLMEEHAAHPERRTAQHRLAAEVTQRVHGAAAAESVAKVSAILFDPDVDLSNLSEETCLALQREAPCSEATLSMPVGVLDVLTTCNACASRGEAKRAVRQGGISINGVRVADEGASIDAGQLHLGRYLFVRVGRKKFYVLSVVR